MSLPAVTILIKVSSRALCIPGILFTARTELQSVDVVGGDYRASVYLSQQASSSRERTFLRVLLPHQYHERLQKPCWCIS